MDDRYNALDDLERMAVLADHLQAQVSPCPYPRLQLVTWVINWVGTPETLRAIEAEGVPETLYDAYGQWIQAKGDAQGD